MLRRQSNRRKALLDITNNNDKSQENIKILNRMSKRKASKNAIMKIVNALSTSGNTSSIEEKVVKKRKKVKKDVYDFTFDSEEDEGQNRKKTRKRTTSTNSADITWQYFETKTNKNKKRKITPAVKKGKPATNTQRKRIIKKPSVGPNRKNVNNPRNIPNKYKNLITDCSVQVDKNLVDEHYKQKLIQGVNRLSVVIEKKSLENKSDPIKKTMKDNELIKSKHGDKNEKDISTIKQVNAKTTKTESTLINSGDKLIKSTIDDPIVIEDTFDDYDNNFEDPLPSPLASSFITISDASIIHQKTLQDEICASFMEDLNDDANITNNPINSLIMNSLRNLKEKLTPNKINIISNVPLRKSKQNIFNSTMKPSLDMSNPWRLNVSNIRNPHTFTIKDKSFVPNYNQDIVMNSTLADKLTPSKNKVIGNGTDKNMQQTSILSFISSTKEHKIDVPVEAGGLFQSPRKVLGEINYQSTPLNPLTRRKILSPNISALKSLDKIDSKDDSENKENTLFGFSCSDENSENTVPEKKKTPKKKRSPKKEKVKAVLFNDDLDVKQIENRETVCEFETPSSADLNALFEDVQNEKLLVKKTRRSYERLRLKRKRLPSVQSEEEENESDAEEEVIQFRLKQKMVNKTSQKEEEEINKLASHYNSMFDEIDKYNLCID